MLNDLWSQVLAWSGKLVTPDWGALVALIPLLLLLVVGAFLAITASKWAAVGPSGAGPGQRLPRTPDGRSLASPSVGPLLLACSVFLLAFGLLAGPAWILAGAVVAVVAAAAWIAGARGRPMPRLPRLTRAQLGVLGAIAFVAVVLVATSRVEPDVPGRAANGAGPGASGASAGGPAATADATPSAVASALPAADEALTAQGVIYLESSLTAPADRPFTVAFDNRDSVPHNLEIRDANGTVVFRGDLVTGPAVSVYDVPTLTAGAYQFICTVHPAMSGALTVK